jgi:3-oxoadipate enol-lactonase
MPKITVGDIDLNYQFKGSGEPLLLLVELSFSLLDSGIELLSTLFPNHQLIFFDNRDASLTNQSQRDYTISDISDDNAGLLGSENPQITYFWY